jgi:hypothetical protein
MNLIPHNTQSSGNRGSGCASRGNGGTDPAVFQVAHRFADLNFGNDKIARAALIEAILLAPTGASINYTTFSIPWSTLSAPLF